MTDNSQNPNNKKSISGATKGDANREARIKQSLRVNLQRRKAKARALKKNEDGTDG